MDDELRSVDTTPDDPEIQSTLTKMEALNRSVGWMEKVNYFGKELIQKYNLQINLRINEADVRSVTSRRSCSSHTGRSSSPCLIGNNKIEDASLPRSNSLQPANIDDDENLDLWTVS